MMVFTATGRPPSEEEPCPLIETRANIYDGDDFDVIEKDVVDTSRIIRGGGGGSGRPGKRKGPKSAEALLNDKTDLAGMKERFAQLSIVSDVVTVNAGADANEEYDDEYDDTYDDNAMGEREPDLDEVCD